MTGCKMHTPTEKQNIGHLAQPACTLLNRISGADVYSERSKDYWLDLMKAASLQGEAGNPSLMVASSNLVRSLVNVARLLVGKPWVEYKQAGKMLRKHSR